MAVYNIAYIAAGQPVPLTVAQIISAGIGLTVAIAVGAYGFFALRCEKSEGETWWMRDETTGTDVEVKLVRPLGKQKRHIIDGTCAMKFERVKAWDAKRVDTGEALVAWDDRLTDPSGVRLPLLQQPARKQYRWMRDPITGKPVQMRAVGRDADGAMRYQPVTPDAR